MGKHLSGVQSQKSADGAVYACLEAAYGYHNGIFPCDFYVFYVVQGTIDALIVIQ